MRLSAGVALSALLVAGEVAAMRIVPRSAYGRLEEARHRRVSESHTLIKRADTLDLTTLYPERNLSVPIDFYHNETRYEPHSNGSFNLRYFFDASYYKPGGPVFVLLGGETDVEDRLPYLQKGIVHQVIEATGGLGVILEHRYYGKSFPVPDLTTENLRFLSTEQALAEIDYFARNVKFEGISADLTAPSTPWIVYGGSYAGAQAAFLRVVYPETFWGTIASSGVTAAIVDYWEYFEPIRLFGPPDCIANTQLLIDVVDGVLLRGNSTADKQKLKSAFGLGGITDDRDFANQLTGVYGWQSTNWDPAVNSASFFNYCNNITNTRLGNATVSADVAAVVAASGHGSDTLAQTVVLNAIDWINATALRSWRSSRSTQDQYFSTVNATQFQGLTDLDFYPYTSWSYQVCTEWGYFQTGNTPPTTQPIVSRLLDLDYTSFFCGAQFNITTPPDVSKVNKYGNFSIDYARLAHLGGNADPWRPATPLWYPESRTSSAEHPWLLIAHGVHHWEENGIFKNETTPTLPPPQIVYAQQFLKRFVVDWLAEWKDSKSRQEL